MTVLSGSGNDSVWIDGHGQDTVVGGSGVDTIFVETHNAGEAHTTVVDHGVTTMTWADGDTLTYSEVEKIVFHDQPH